MTDRFRYQNEAARFSDRIEWLFYDSLLADHVHLIFYLRTRHLQARRPITTTSYNVNAPAWIEQLESSLPLGAMAEAISIALTLE